MIAIDNCQSITKIEKIFCNVFCNFSCISSIIYYFLVDLLYNSFFFYNIRISEELDMISNYIFQHSKYIYIYINYNYEQILLYIYITY